MLFNREFGKIGMISFPYWVFFEWLAPLIEFAGIVYFAIMLTLGMLNTKIFLLLLVMVFVSSLVFSFFAVFYETYIFYRYRGFKFLLAVLGTCLLEMPVYHPLNIIFSINGNYDFFFRKNKKGWGKMTRTGFDKNLK